MPAPLTIHLIRHGEVHNPDGILYGRMPGFRLSETGRGQASAAARVLADRSLTAIYASPMQRAQETAQIIAAAQEPMLEIFTDERLNEVHSPFDGTSHAEMDRIFYDLYTGTEPPYEQPEDLRKRVEAFFADMRRVHAGGEIAAVTHGDIVVTAFMYAKQQPRHDIGRKKTDPDRERLLRLGLPEPYPMTASVSTLVYTTDDPAEVPTYHYERPY